MNIQRGRQEDLGLKAEDGWMDAESGCAGSGVRKLCSLEGLLGSTSWSRVGHPMLMWNLGGSSPLGSTGSGYPHTWCLSIYKL